MLDKFIAERLSGRVIEVYFGTGKGIGLKEKLWKALMRSLFLKTMEEKTI
ncbi:MAG: hypothetical protein MUO26_12305 [Methanotrichaceae archaeon]|nr:hypothetical protein [Methanotrichaceae archaeon]